MIGRYRIYPAWFRDAGAKAPMEELALREAHVLGRVVTSIDIVGQGEDHRGHFINFDVTYSSSEGGMYGYGPRPADC